MQVTNFETTAFERSNPVGAIRGTGDGLKMLLSREAPSRAFNLVYTRNAGEGGSPRHRHNFEQVRMLLAGRTRYGRHVFKERMIGYFPEGTYYGPTTPLDVGERALLSLQFDGPSACGYLPYRLIKAATEELKQRGAFRGGVYYPEGGKPMEAYQAALEQATGTKTVYPTPRYDDPLFMNVDAFPWRPAGSDGVRRKRIATFGEGGLGISMAKVAPGAWHRISADGASVIAFLLDGKATLASGEGLSRYSAVLVECTEAIELTGDGTDVEVIEFALPSFEEATSTKVA